ncbi:MAG: hypothetical protein II387_03275, partial [Oscillospiraceae bacterium]|nr:hypothetical protein [Oscillospiraceae bacterium]
MGMTTAEFNAFMAEETEEEKKRESGNAALSPSASQPVSQASTPAPSTGRVSKADFNSYMTQKAKADNFNTYGADYESWINDVNAFGKNAYNQTQSWKDAGTASALVAQNRESAAALKTRGQGIYNFFTNYADDIDTANGAGTAQRVLDSITSAQKGIDDTQSYVDYVTQGWAAAPDAETYANYQSWAQNPRSSADVIKDIESARTRVKGLEDEKAQYDELKRNSDAGYGTWASWGNSPDPGARALYSQNMAEREKLISDVNAKSAELEDATKSLATLRQELVFRQDNEAYEKQQRWKENPRSSEEVMRDIEELTPRVEGFYDYALKDA